MKQQDFERQGQRRWDAFDAALANVQRGYRLGDDDHSEEFVRAYQRVVRDLSMARSRGYSRRLVAHLNGLAIRGHNTVYVYRSSFVLRALRFIATGFPRRIRAEWRYVLLSTLLFAGPLLGIAALVYVSPEYVYSIYDADSVRSFETMYGPEQEVLGRERGADTDFAMFGHYIMNNISIAFRMLAGGLVWGLITLFYLIYNGVFIGGVAGHLLQLGYQERFLSFVCGHGAFELTGLVFAGAGGLLLGHSLINPGALKRRESLKRAGSRAVEIILGTTLMLVLAAFIEAFWSSSTTVPPVIKYWVAAVLWSLVFTYILLAGRRHGT